MALSTAERQARYRQRLKDAAMADVQVLVGITDMGFSDRAKSWLPIKLPVSPVPGDTLVIRQGDGEWTARVVSRTIRESGYNGATVLIECEGHFKVDER